MHPPSWLKLKRPTRGCEATRPQILGLRRRQCELAQATGEQVWVVLVHGLTHLPFDPIVPFLDVYSRSEYIYYS